MTSPLLFFVNLVNTTFSIFNSKNVHHVPIYIIQEHTKFKKEKKKKKMTEDK